MIIENPTAIVVSATGNISEISRVAMKKGGFIHTIKIQVKKDGEETGWPVKVFPNTFPAGWEPKAGDNITTQFKIVTKEWNGKTYYEANAMAIKVNSKGAPVTQDANPMDNIQIEELPF